MALLVVVDDKGKSHLIHSGQIGPSWGGAKAVGQWSRAWERFDAQKSRNEDAR